MNSIILDKLDVKIIEYLDQGMKIRQIAKELQLSNDNVAKRIMKMKENDIPILTVHQEEKLRKKPSDAINKKILEGLDEGKTQTQIAKEVNLSTATVNYRINKMKELGIEIPTLSKGRPKKDMLDEIDKKILEGLDEGKTQTQIAKELNLSRQVVYARIKKMPKYGIKISNKKEEINRLILEQLSAGKTKKQISEELNLSFNSIYKRINTMKKHGIEIPDIPKRKIQKKNPKNKKSEEIDEKALIEKILELKETKNATDEQIILLARYYKVEDEILKVLSNKER